MHRSLINCPLHFQFSSLYKARAVCRKYLNRFLYQYFLLVNYFFHLENLTCSTVKIPFLHEKRRTLFILQLCLMIFHTQVIKLLMIFSLGEF